jgi:hypothetical protein
VYILSLSQMVIGEWLSLVEHLVRDQGVGGSNPLSPTNLINNLGSNLSLEMHRFWGGAPVGAPIERRDCL